MDDDAAQLLREVAQLCLDQRPPSQEHWDRLYAFTLHVHLRGLEIPGPTVREYLIRERCSFQKANWASGEYRRFVDLLKRYDKERSRMKT